MRDFNVTVLLHCELYTGFLQRINQFSSSVKFANGYYENQLTYSNRWWYFYMSEIYVWSMNNIFVTVRGLKSNDYVKFHRLSQYTKQTNLPHDVSYLCFSLPAMKLVRRRGLWWTDQRNKIMVTSDNHCRVGVLSHLNWCHVTSACVQVSKFHSYPGMMIIIITVIIVKGTWQRVLREKLLKDNLIINFNTRSFLFSV